MPRRRPRPASRETIGRTSFARSRRNGKVCGTCYSSTRSSSPLTKTTPKRFAGLEDLVIRLRSQVANLAHSLKSQAESIDDLRAHRPETPVPNHTLEDEVASLQTGLESLGAEVDAVRSVVDGLVRERVTQANWEREVNERKMSMDRAREAESELEGLARRRDHERSRRSPAPPPLAEETYRRMRREESALEDPDRTPRARRTYGAGKRTGPGTPQTEKSFHSVRSDFTASSTEL